MPNPEAQMPDNAVSNILNQLSGMRGVNQELRRSSPGAEEPPPLTDDEIMAAFARDTGQVINDAGAVIGKTCPQYAPQMGTEKCGTCQWPRSYHGAAAVPIENPQRAQINDAPVERITQVMHTQPEEVTREMFGLGKRKPFVPGSRLRFDQIQGINLQDGVVLIDGYEFEREPEDVKSVTRFCLDVFAKSMQKQLTSMVEGYGLKEDPPPATTETLKPEALNAEVPAVPPGPPAGGIQPGQDEA